MEVYVKIDEKIIGEFDVMNETLGSFLKKRNISDVIETELTVISLKTEKDKNQLELKLEDS